MGERARRGPATPSGVAGSAGFDLARAESVLPLIGMLLGVPTANPDGAAR